MSTENAKKQKTSHDQEIIASLSSSIENKVGFNIGLAAKPFSFLKFFLHRNCLKLLSTQEAALISL